MVSIAKEMKKIGNLDNNMKEDIDIVVNKIQQQFLETKKVYFQDDKIPLTEEMLLVTLQIDQTLNFIEELNNKSIEHDIYRTDYDTISRKQEKLRLNTKTLEKADSMEKEVNLAEKLAKESKKIVNEMENNFQNELDQFHTNKSISVIRGLKHFIEFQCQMLRVTKNIYEN
jgi:hypothetical protein